MLLVLDFTAATVGDLQPDVLCAEASATLLTLDRRDGMATIGVLVVVFGGRCVVEVSSVRPALLSRTRSFHRFVTLDSRDEVVRHQSGHADHAELLRHHRLPLLVRLCCISQLILFLLGLSLFGTGNSL